MYINSNSNGQQALFFTSWSIVLKQTVLDRCIILLLFNCLETQNVQLVNHIWNARNK